MHGMGKAICTKVELFRSRKAFLWFSAVIIAGLGGQLVQASWPEKVPPQKSLLQVFLLDATQLERSRAALAGGDKVLAPAWSRLEREAQQALSTGPFTIMSKGVVPRVVTSMTT